MEEHYFECACHSPEHRLVFSIDAEDKHKEVYASMFINQYHNIFMRTWIAIKYIFGYKCKYGHFDCWMLKSEDVPRLRDMCDEILKPSEDKGE